MEEASHHCAQTILAVAFSQNEETASLTSTGIAKTTFPDERMDYSSTFQHIRCELDHFYKEENPIFSNSTAPDLWLSKSGDSSDKKQKSQKASSCIELTRESYTKEGSSTLLNTSILPTGVAKTVIPSERPGFNETFLNIRYELDELYRAQNPVFTNAVTPELWISKSPNTELQPNTNKPTLPIEQTLQNNYTEVNTSLKKNNPLPLSISKTTVPDERLDFNSTFQHIHNELLDIYQKQKLSTENMYKPGVINPKTTAIAQPTQLDKTRENGLIFQLNTEPLSSQKKQQLPERRESYSAL